MTRLPFVLDDFTRVSWVSDAAKAHWDPILSTIKSRWGHVERETVYRGIRQAAITDCAPHQFPDLIVEAASRGCVAVPLEVTASHGYAASSRPPGPGESGRQRVALAHPEASAPFLAAWRAHDHDAMGALLGFPSCCRGFFQQVWILDRHVDTTYRQAHGQADILGYHSEANVLGRWMGVRAVPHLPCAFTCEATVAVAASWKAVADELGYRDSWAQIDHVTRWQTAWTALHGIAEIVTPVWKVIARTDATPRLLRVHVHGDQVPAHAATGLTFPYPRVASTAPAPDPRLWTDNGFSSREAMTRAHDAIVATVKAWRPVPGPVLDLGCGNGVLVRKLSTGARGGIDIDADRIARALQMDSHGAYRVGDLRSPATWPDGPWALTLCMAGRLTEGETGAARAALHGRPVAFYAYQDWLQGRTLRDLVREAGHGDRAVLAERVTEDVAVMVVD